MSEIINMAGFCSALLHNSLYRHSFQLHCRRRFFARTCMCVERRAPPFLPSAELHNILAVLWRISIVIYNDNECHGGSVF